MSNKRFRGFWSFDAFKPVSLDVNPALTAVTFLGSFSHILTDTGSGFLRSGAPR